MIQNLFLILLLASLGCGSKVDVESQMQSVATGQMEPQMASAVATVAKRDTTPSRVTSSSRIMVDRSRKIENIRAEFPFDIPLEDADQQLTTSDKILPENGKPTVVLFWLTTCYPCRVEMKAITEKYDSWTSEADFNIVAISTDWDKHAERFAEMAKTEGWPWAAYRDTDREFRKVLPGGLNGLPQTFVFDKDGEIVYHSRKYRQGDEDKLFAAIKSAGKT